MNLSLHTKISSELSRAALFKAIARGFTYPLPQHTAQMRELLAGLQPPLTYSKSQQIKLGRAIRHARRAWKMVKEQHLEGEYIHLFLTNTVCPMNETAYGDGRSSLGRSSVLADVGGFYTAFGLQATEKAPNLPDHLCSELEFYSLLLFKHAYARNQRWKEKQHITQRAMVTFLKEHLGCWTTAFTKTLRGQTLTPALLSMAHLLDVLINCECQLLKVQPLKSRGRVTGDEMQEDTLICPHDGHAPSH